MDISQKLDNLLQSLPTQSVKIVYKRGWFWKLLNCIILILTLGQNKRFLTDYVTTINKTIGVPENFFTDWSKLSQYLVLNHELYHIKQLKKYGLILFGFSYLFLPLPIGLAYFRYKFERDAYLDELKLYVGILRESDVEITKSLINWNINGIAEGLSGAGYVWAWPFKNSIKQWYEKQLEGVLTH